MFCQKCGKPATDNNRFCTECGSPLETGQMASPPVLSAAAATLNISSQAESDALIGQTIADKYRIDALLGKGGMGKVYRATRLFIGDAVALKVMSAERVSDHTAVERFRREAQAAARLKHPNAVSIYDFGVSSQGIVYLVMELVAGQSLRHIISQQGPLTPAAASEILNQVCAALEEAHKHNIIHRDIKPDNIVVDARGDGLSVKVLDFGIAKLRDLSATATNLTQTGSVVGTPNYMSPEQCLGEELDHRSDIYSLGIVLYESLTGIVPFNSPTSAAIVVQQVTQPPPPLRSINISISPMVESVVMRALQKKREDRPQTALALAREFSAAVRGAAFGVSNTGSVLNAPTAGGAAAGLAPTVQMSAPVMSSGSVTPVSLQTPVAGQLRQWPDSAIAAPSRKRRLSIIIAVAAVALAAVGAIFYMNASSTKKSILDEIKKGNLVKPRGGSAFDLYFKNKNELAESDKTRIADEAVPALEKRGEEVLGRAKEDFTRSEDEWDEAGQIYSWLNDLRPKPAYEARKYFAQASLAFVKGDYAKALPDYERCVQLESSWALALNRTGATHVRLDNKRKARYYYERAVNVEPNWINPWINLGNLCFGMGDYAAADIAAQRILQIDPQRSSGHRLRALLYEKQGFWCEAVQSYKQAIEYAYRTPDFDVGDVRRRMGKISSYPCY
jgi:serine/threonine protein kinase